MSSRAVILIGAAMASTLSAALPVRAATPLNLALSAEAIASSRKSADHPPGHANDGVVSDSSRWLNVRGPGPHTLELRFAASFEIASVHLYSGWRGGSAIGDARLEYWDGRQWRAVPGGELRDNPARKTAVRISFDQSVVTTRLRLISDTNEYVRLSEFAVFGPHENGSPPLWTAVSKLGGNASTSPAAPDLTRHYVLANQTGYNTGWPKRFTAPISPDGSTFSIARVDGSEVLFRGTIIDNIGDFTPLSADDDQPLVIRVEGKGLRAAESHPFVVRPFHTQRMALAPAFRFMIDCRSVVGTHPSAYGGHPWRDGTYYTYEVPSLVLLYLANPAFFDGAPREIDYPAERSRVLDPRFRLVKAKHDHGALDVARRYYRELDPPRGKLSPDLVQLLHWGVGYQLLDPANHDPSGDPLGERIHPQTVEQLAYFLYGLPVYREHFSERFVDRATRFAFDHWSEVGLFEEFREIGNHKGREAPGHSIAPNLMMHEVAKRLGRDDAEHFLSAAVAQVEWLVTSVDPGDPRVARGQRMSEWKTMFGLWMLHQTHRDLLPDRFDDWMSRWVDHAIRRSENLYDFRKYNESQWTLPKPWSDPGSVAGGPGVMIMAKSMIQDEGRRDRLDQLKASHFDALFGRNPVGATSSRKTTAYPGIDRGWPVKYGDNICARLELCRGVLNTIAAHEHYPFNPSAKFRHPEGWSGFNAAFNVSLAFCCWEDTSVRLNRSGTLGEYRLVVDGPLGPSPGRLPDYATSRLVSNVSRELNLAVQEPSLFGTRFSARVEAVTELSDRRALPRIGYGYEPFRKTTLDAR